MTRPNSNRVYDNVLNLNICSSEMYAECV